MIILKESKAGLIHRILSNPVDAVTPQGLLISQSVVAVQVKVFASDLIKPDPRTKDLKNNDNELVTEIDPTIYTRTFRVGQKTIVTDLVKCAADYWGFTAKLAMLYTVEEDGTLRDLQYEQ